MKKTVAIAAMSLALISSQARADEHRPGDAALGALSGAVVLGPIGAVAGAVVGYTSGPSIAHSWGLRRSGHAPARQARTAVRDARPKAAPAAQPAVPGAKPTGAPSSSVP